MLEASAILKSVSRDSLVAEAWQNRWGTLSLEVKVLCITEEPFAASTPYGFARAWRSAGTHVHGFYMAAINVLKY